MAALTTTYDIKLQYSIGGDANRGLDLLANKADSAARSTLGLKDALLGIGAAIGASKLFSEGKEAFIDFNNQMQQLQISLGAVIKMNLGGTFDEAKGAAKGMFEEFQRFAVQSPLTTKEIAEFGKSISAATFTQGGSLRDFIQLTEQGALAAKIMGVNADYAGVEIAHMLSGDVSSRMLFAMNMLKPELAKRGMDREAFKAMDPAARLKLVMDTFKNFGSSGAQKEFLSSFEGVWSTFKDKMQISLGKIGQPLFEKITKEIASWNEWLDKNDKLLHDMGATVGDMLVKGFEAAKTAAKFIVDHKGELMLLAGIWTANKVGGGLANSFLSLSGGLSDLLGRQLPSTFGGLATASTQLVSQFVGLSTAVGLAALGLKVFADYVDREQKKTIESKADFATFSSDLAKGAKNNPSSPKMFGYRSGLDDFLASKDQFAAAIHAVTLAKEMHAGREAGTIAAEVFRSGLIQKGANIAQAQYLTEGAMAAVEYLAQEKGIDFVKRILGFTTSSFNVQDEAYGGKRANVMNPGTTIKVEKIEVASDDPDRFAFGLVHAFENMVKNPTTAKSVPHGIL